MAPVHFLLVKDSALNKQEMIAYAKAEKKVTLKDDEAELICKAAGAGAKGIK